MVDEAEELLKDILEIDRERMETENEVQVLST